MIDELDDEDDEPNPLALKYIVMIITALAILVADLMGF